MPMSVSSVSPGGRLTGVSVDSAAGDQYCSGNQVDQRQTEAQARDPRYHKVAQRPSGKKTRIGRSFHGSHLVTKSCRMSKATLV